MSEYINGAPAIYNRGTKDESIPRQYPKTMETLPQHLPKFFIYAQRGKTEDTIVHPDDLISYFGDKTFDERSKYFNHSTVFLKNMAGTGQVAVVKRIEPVDANPPANIILWMDVLETKVDDFERELDGSYKEDVDGNNVILDQVDGYKVFFTATCADDKTEFNNLKKLEIVNGSQVETVTGKISKRVPIGVFKTPFFGENGNLSGIRLWSPNAAEYSVPSKFVKEERAYPYVINVIRKETEKSSPVVQETKLGSQDLIVSFKQGAIDPVSTAVFDIEENFVEAFNNTRDSKYPLLIGDFSEFYLYRNNLETYLKKFHTAEKTLITTGYDFTTSADDIHLFNFIGGHTLNGVKYRSFQLVEATGAVSLNNLSNIYAKGGSDGTMNNEEFALAVKDHMVGYLDENSRLQDTAISVETVMYDTGYPLDTKYALCNFISKRKNTFLFLTTFVDGEEPLTNEQEYSLGVALNNHLKLFPESYYYGTEVMRGTVFNNDGLIRNSIYRKRVPLLFDVAISLASYAGAADGVWKSGKAIDDYPNNKIQRLYDLRQTFIGPNTRLRYWDIGLNWAQPHDHQSFFIPGFNTAYGEDTSVLNNIPNALIICHVNTVTDRAWRRFTPAGTLTDSQRVERINTFIKENTNGKFDGRAIVEPNAQYTEEDKRRGFSTTTPVNVYLAVSKTVMTTFVVAKRISDYATA